MQVWARAAAVGAEALVDLGGQLACGSHDECAAAPRDRASGRGGQALENGQGEGGGLAGSGLRAAEKVSPGEKGRDRFGLYRRGALVTLRGDGGDQGFVQPERCECRIVHIVPWNGRWKGWNRKEARFDRSFFLYSQHCVEYSTECDHWYSMRY
jgi:hypothetical protein